MGLWKNMQYLRKKIKMGVIRLNNIRCYAYHGCLTEEAKIGSAYRVDLFIKTDLSKASTTDKLEDTVDYVQLNRIVIEEMKVRSNLLENVTQRILDHILNDFSAVAEARVKVAKINPPLGGDVESVSVELSQTR